MPFLVTAMAQVDETFREFAPVKDVRSILARAATASLKCVKC